MNKHQEDYEQTLIFQWSAYFPVLRWMFHPPNGGKRSPREASRLKAQGVKSGVADILLPLPMDGFHGLWIELKRRKQDGPSKVSPKQKKFLRDMAEKGYRCEVCYGANEAIKVITEYAKL